MSEEFEWVLERAKCSASVVYQEFVKQVKRDVELRNGARSAKEHRNEINFTFSGGYEPTSIVIGANKGGEFLDRTRLAQAIITKIPEGVAVEYLNETKLSGLLTLSLEGECRFKVDGVEYSFWQFRKLALEPVLFDAVKDFRE